MERDLTDADVKELKSQIAEHEADACRLWEMIEAKERILRAHADKPALEESRRRVARAKERAKADAAAAFTDDKIAEFASLLQIPAPHFAELQVFLREQFEQETLWRARCAEAKVSMVAMDDVRPLVKSGRRFLKDLKRVPTLRGIPSLFNSVDRTIRNLQPPPGRPAKTLDCPRYAKFATAFIDEILRLNGTLTLTRGRSQGFARQVSAPDPASASAHSAKEAKLRKSAGTLLTALAKLRPLFPADFIPVDLREYFLEERLKKAKAAVKKAAPESDPRYLGCSSHTADTALIHATPTDAASGRRGIITAECAHGARFQKGGGLQPR